RWLDVHNIERERYGSQKLTWNPELVMVAQKRAATCVFEHVPGHEYGENIAAGQDTILEVGVHWIDGPDEKAIYDPKSDTGVLTHWTQVVWNASNELGCYQQTCNPLAGISLGSGSSKFWVCQYKPSVYFISHFTNYKISNIYIYTLSHLPP
ncbi:hypothetical protein CROQUDRAFT_40125, partial [Cronartium quercuum f. sp. fusiforme G11]